MILNQNLFNCLFFHFSKKCIGPIKSCEKFASGFYALLWIKFSLVLKFIQFPEDSCLYWSMILRPSRIFRCWNQNVLSCYSGLFVLRSSFRYAVRSRSPCGILLRIAISTGLMCLDCSGVTTENSAMCVFLIHNDIW